jgi:hypothetical protein
VLWDWVAKEQKRVKGHSGLALVDDSDPRKEEVIGRSKDYGKGKGTCCPLNQQCALRSSWLHAS